MDDRRAPYECFVYMSWSSLFNTESDLEGGTISEGVFVSICLRMWLLHIYMHVQHNLNKNKREKIQHLWCAIATTPLIGCIHLFGWGVVVLCVCLLPIGHNHIYVLASQMDHDFEYFQNSKNPHRKWRL